MSFKFFFLLRRNNFEVKNFYFEINFILLNINKCKKIFIYLFKKEFYSERERKKEKNKNIKTRKRNFLIYLRTKR